MLLGVAAGEAGVDLGVALGLCVGDAGLDFAASVGEAGVLGLLAAGLGKTAGEAGALVPCPGNSVAVTASTCRGGAASDLVGPLRFLAGFGRDF